MIFSFRHDRLEIEAVCGLRSAVSVMLRVMTVVTAAILLFAVAKAHAASGIYRPINYQGRITNSGGVAVTNDAYNMRFKIFDVPTGGTALWTETWDATTQQVTLTGGLFSVALGTQTAMTGSVDFNTDSLYLQVEFDPAGDSSYSEIFSPRRRFGSVPFAHNADTLDGLHATKFVRSDADATASGTLTIRPRDASKTGLDILSNAGGANIGALKLSTQGANHIVFGSGGTNYDTNLYRSAIAMLRTDGAFVVAGALSGSTVHAEKSITSSGTILAQGNIRTRGALSGRLLVISGNASVSGSLVVSRTLGVGIIGAAGSYNSLCYSSTGMLVTCTSSIRYKEDVLDLGMGLETIHSMRPVSFRWKSDGTPDIGLIAEEMATVDPRLVFERNGLIEGVRYQQITPILINAAKALDVRTLGITNASGTVLHAADLIAGSGSLRIEGSGTFGSGILIRSKTTDGTTNLLEIQSNVGGTGTTALRVNASGSVFIGGTFNAHGADYAEWFRESDGGSVMGDGGVLLEPGEAVCLNPGEANAVRRCDRDGDPNIIGIVSTDPAFIGNVVRGVRGGAPVPRYVLVGLIGQVPAKAIVEGSGALETELGRIRPGDSLTAAAKPGWLRKAKAGESTVGVALEGLENGEGVIRVLISRRNQSLTVETVEQEVTRSIAAMNIQDQIRANLQDGLAKLDLAPAVRQQITTELTALDIDALVAAAVQRRLSGAVLPAPAVTDSFMSEVTERLRSGTGLTVTDPALSQALEDLRVQVQGIASMLTGSHLRLKSADIDDLVVRNSFTVPGTMVLSAGRMEGNIPDTGSGLTIGAMRLSGTGVTIGSLTVSGAFRVIGPVTIEGLATFLGDVRIQGQLILSNRQAGFAVIPESGSAVTVMFDQPMTATPVVTATPDIPVLFGVGSVTPTGFVIRIAAPATENIMFSFIALSADAPRTVMGTGSLVPGDGLIAFPVNAKGQPFSVMEPVWTACVQGRQTMDALGIPFNCSRYHDGFVWEHPDLKINFTWNPNHDPRILTIPAGYRIVVMDDGFGDDTAVTQDETPHAAAPEEGSGAVTGSGSTAGSGETLHPAAPSDAQPTIIPGTTGEGQNVPATPDGGAGETPPADTGTSVNPDTPPATPGDAPTPPAPSDGTSPDAPPVDAGMAGGRETPPATDAGSGEAPAADPAPAGDTQNPPSSDAAPADTAAPAQGGE